MTINLFLLAVGDINGALGRIVGLFQAISMVVMMGAFLVASVSVVSGRLEYLKYAILGGALSGLSWVLIQTLFNSIGGTTIDFTPQSF